MYWNATFSAYTRSAYEFEQASTRMIAALGAKTWAHSMSSDSSRAQPGSAGGALQAPLPFAKTFTNLAAGKPKCVENAAKSDAASGLSYASTSAMAP